MSVSLALSDLSTQQLFNTAQQQTAELHTQQKAQEVYARIQENIEFCKQALRDCHTILGDSYLNIADSFDQLQNYDRARQCFIEALEVEIAEYGENHSDVAASYNNIGVMYGKEGNLQQALSYQQKALSVWLEVYGANHPDVMIGYCNVALTLKKMGHYDEALENYHQALIVVKNSNDLQNLETIVSALLNCLQLASRFWETDTVARIEAFLRENLGDSHQLTQQFMQAKKSALKL
jgi:tetratricopeptide (TPR) repeat protein